MNRIFQLFVLTVFTAFFYQCKVRDTTEVFCLNRNQIEAVDDRIVFIETKFYFGASSLKLIDSFLVVTELLNHNSDKCIHLFNKNDFSHVASVGKIGRGPQEVTRPGPTGIDYNNRILWITDHGKRTIWKFPLDSILRNKNYSPSEREKVDFQLSHFLVYYDILNDSLAIGKAILPISGGGFEMKTSLFNLKSGNIEEFGYTHPSAVGRWVSNSRSHFSTGINVFVSCYNKIDLITITNLQGELLFNIYGPDWQKNKDFINEFFTDVIVTQRNIYLSYNGGAGVVLDDNKRQRGVYPSKIMVFDFNGSYVKTFDLGNEFVSFCIDEEKRRAIVYFNDRENPLGFLNLL